MCGYLIQCQFLLTNIKIIVWQIVRRITIEIVGMRGYMIDKKLLVMSGKKKSRKDNFLGFLLKKKITSMLAFRKLYVARTNQIV